MKGLGFIRKIVSVMVISTVFMFVVGVNNAKAFDLSSFVDIGSGETQGATTTTQETTTEETTNNTTNNVENNATNNTTNKTSNSVSSSTSKDSKLPATGSNVEIIFIAGAIVLVSTTVIIYKKSRIKIK